MIDTKQIVSQVLEDQVKKIKQANPKNQIPELVINLTASMLLQVLEQYDTQLGQYLIAHSEEKK
ncbi:hypothetical protein [Ezakiella peruensis]|uniref:hypothetical protein n=1 Tax=Ezakiella peruensis TaxID=1464038 RepID=UPI000C1B1A48|nr:hypothetical protein [Ezakiella peruensis]